ncbi:LysR substrate-binding domain-containing protein [Hoeflea sp. G2-23]|uniref:LysR substrate-binding domain-containing protein n=1 Tax=Hoeflea algicola TaxID=2983763 RepID=A0ABT3ZD95_9HYPH|nr:LysR substrate-binding domain-containing protein [Hoeflea algicola]MCY0149611.1 LysR substrate-binding domain-containing protein [Hoeflea algicola]
MHFTFRQLQYFVHAAELGTISGAAAAVRISQSAITESIRQLEGQVGTMLFERHARGIALTYEGHRFLRYAKLILATIKDAQDAFTVQSKQVSGVLRLGVTSLVAGYFLTDILARFRRVFPDVSVEVVEDHRRFIEHLLISGELQLALMVTSNIEEPFALSRDPLMRSRYRVWVSPKNPLADKSLVRPSDLRGQKLVLLAVDDLMESISGWLGREQLMDKVFLRTTSVEAVRSLVGADAGVAIMPDLAFRPYTLEGDRLEARSIDGLSTTLDVGLVWRQGSPDTDQAEIFKTVAKDYNARR